MDSNVVVIGLGGMGLRHCQAIQQLENVNLFAVCDLDEIKAIEARKAYNAKMLYTNWKDLITTYHDKIDLVIIATNGDTHHEIAKYASYNGIKAVLCEKPFTTSITKAIDLVNTCEHNKTNLAVHHIRRWSESYKRLKHIIQDGTIGDIRQISFEMGGGQLASNGGHLFDLARYLTDKNPTKVLGFLDTKGTPNPRGDKFSDPGAYGIVWFDDVRVYFDMSEDYGTPMMFKILGSLGHIIVDEKDADWRISARRIQDRQQPLTRRPNLVKIPFEGHGMMDMVETCKLSITDILEGNVSCSGYDGLMSLTIPIAVHVSHDNDNQIVELPLTEEQQEKEYSFT